MNIEDLDDLAAQMTSQCAAEGQSARIVVSDDDAASLRKVLRGSAGERQLTVRTARIDAVVAVVRTDAAIWNDSSAVMRAKLTPPPDSQGP